MSTKLRIAVLCGGKSPEHEISLCSAWNLVNAIDKDRFDIVLIGIDRSGNWYLQDQSEFLSQEPFAGTIELATKHHKIAAVPGEGRSALFDLETSAFLDPINVVFPMLHGPNGEDGSMQGLIRQLGLPFVGPGVVSSAICMDKDIAKRLMQHAGIPTSDFISCYSHQRALLSFDDARNRLGLPLFVKPANLGSSVGISKVVSESEFKTALDTAFEHDNKIVIEQFIAGREIECAVLGNRDPFSSVPGQYVHEDDFFAYDTKYLKDRDVVMEIPAHDLDDSKIEEVKALALKTYKCLQCEGLSRVDIFLSDDGSLNVNEVNTLPGFTNSSMYPGLMGSAGISYTNLVTHLIELAIERHAAAPGK